MNYRQLAQVGLGLLGVWALLDAAALFVQIAGVVGGSLAPLVLAEIIPVVLLLGFSYLLIFHNAKVAAAIFPEAAGASDPAPSDLARVLVALTGVLLLVRAAPLAINGILTLLSLSDAEPTARGDVVGRTVATLIPIGVGIYLLARPSRFLEFLDRPMTAPTAESD